MTEQYLNKQKLIELVSISDFTGFKPISTDSYSDIEIYKTIKNKGGMKLLLYCALQTAIVGSRNKIFGEFNLEGEKMDVKSVYKEYNVRDDLSLQSKIQPGELTPRRLQRFFRVQIKNYLENNKEICPYLWKKYSNLNMEYRTITFPGAESLIETKEEGLYLLQTYENLDNMLNLSISERIKRVLLARKILEISDIHDNYQIGDISKQAIVFGDNFVKNVTNTTPENDKVQKEIQELLEADGSWEKVKNDKELLNFIKEVENFLENKN